jgi:hypothetical protein
LDHVMMVLPSTYNKGPKEGDIKEKEKYILIME